eukprot:4219799-Pleurochrysis_carterae.AAC.1
MDEQAWKVVSFSISTTPSVVSSSRALELTTTQPPTSHAETKPQESARADAGTASMTGIRLADPQERQSQTSNDARHSSTTARAGEGPSRALNLGRGRPRNTPPPPKVCGTTRHHRTDWRQASADESMEHT